MSGTALLLGVDGAAGGGGGGGGTPALVAHTTTATTSSAIDTTGATLLVIAQAYASGSAFTPPTDNVGNSYTALTVESAGGVRIVLYYCANPTTSPAHTFTNNETDFGTQGFFGALCVAAFSGTDTSSPFNQENGGSASFGTTVQPGSVTPSQSGELIITAINPGTPSPAASYPASIDSGFTVIDAVSACVAGGNACALAYLVQAAAAAVNPTWTNAYNNPSSYGAVIATFKP